MGAPNIPGKLGFYYHNTQTQEKWIHNGDNWIPFLDTGSVGKDGDSAYQIWLDAGNVGTEQEFLNSLVGSNGTSATVDVDPNPVSADPDDDVVVQNTGDTTNAVFKFTIPRGLKGEPGENGSGITVQGSDTITNIIARPGVSGHMWISTTVGIDDLGNAVAIGDGIVYDGSSWVTVGQIRGPIGPTGADSTVPGQAATVDAGTAVEGPIEVTNSGTSSAAIFNFKIPRGLPGVTPTVIVSETVTLNAGEDALVEDKDTGVDLDLKFSIPRGPQGPPGEGGGKGEDGTAATIVVGTTVEGPAKVFNSGTTSAAILDFTVPKGDPGTTVTVGTTATGNPGTIASVANGDTSGTGDVRLDFIIPRGDKGNKGKDGSGVVVKGSAPYATIEATPGAAGDMWISSNTGGGHTEGDGLVSNGLGAGPANWTNVGPIRGPQGVSGSNGTSADIVGVTASRVPYTDSPSVVLGGNALARTFEFKIPDAAPGEGLIAGGIDGQILTKDGVGDYDTKWTSLPTSQPISFISGLQTALNNKEPKLGSPSTDDYILSSKIDGTREWIPAPIGGGTDDGFKVADFNAATKFTIKDNEKLSFAGGGGTTVAFNTADKKVTISSPTYSVFTTTAVGLVPSPGASSTGKFLRGDGTWQDVTMNTVEGSAPIKVTPVGQVSTVSITQATGSVDGYLTSVDWNTFNSKTSNSGTITGVDITAGSGLTGTESTTSGVHTQTLEHDTGAGWNHVPTGGDGTDLILGWLAPGKAQWIPGSAHFHDAYVRKDGGSVMTGSLKVGSSEFGSVLDTTNGLLIRSGGPYSTSYRKEGVTFSNPNGTVKYEQFKLGISGTDTLQWDQLGNVGIGTVPIYGEKLAVTGKLYSTDEIHSPNFRLLKGYNAQFAMIPAVGSNSYVYTTVGSDLHFGIGSSYNNRKLSLTATAIETQSDIKMATGTALKVGGRISNNGDRLMMQLTNDGSQMEIGPVQDSGTIEFKGGTSSVISMPGALNVTGNVTSIDDVSANSDIRLKEDLKPLDSKVIMKGLHGYNYYRKDLKKRQNGLIAQDVEKVLPEAVVTAKDEMGTKSISYNHIVAVLVEDNKRLQKELNELKLIVDALR